MTTVRAYPTHDNRTDYGREPHSAHAPAFRFADVDLFAGDPITPQPRRRNKLLTAVVVIAIITASGWGLSATEDWWRPWATERIAVTVASFESKQPVAAPAPASAPGAVREAIPAAPLATKDVAATPGAQAGTPLASTAQEPAAASQASASQGADDAPPATETPAPLPPPKADPDDPYQQRALAAGLHPGVSRVLLSRMSDVDFRNVAAAVRKALAEITDDGKLVWPPRAEAKLAQFQVHFVAGAGPDCRRYVVTVNKDGWVTTALPMEKCGQKRAVRG